MLAAVEPAACLTQLNALVSPNPYDLEAVEPFIAFDLKRFRFTDDVDVIAGLDSRPNLLNLTPTEFEHLVKQLFVAMGAEAWTTIPSKDGGVDTVATSKHLFFGGVCLIQAKRWTGLVGLEAVHALTGVMADHNATTGVLVTTSWFGRASEQFANRNRITLINSAELKQLLKAAFVHAAAGPPQGADRGGGERAILLFATSAAVRLHGLSRGGPVASAQAGRRSFAPSAMPRPIPRRRAGGSCWPT